MTTTDGDAFTFYQKIFEDSYDEVTASKEKVHRQALSRKGAAYSLKAIAVFGGIAIAAGLPVTIAHVVGIAITVAVAIDGLFMNQLKLITLTKADNAYKHLLRDTAKEHETKLGPILELKPTDEAEAKNRLNRLNSSLKTWLDSESKKIEVAIDETDVKALNALSLETEGRGASAHS